MTENEIKDIMDNQALLDLSESLNGTLTIGVDEDSSMNTKTMEESLSDIAKKHGSFYIDYNSHVEHDRWGFVFSDNPDAELYSADSLNTLVNIVESDLN